MDKAEIVVLELLVCDDASSIYEMSQTDRFDPCCGLTLANALGAEAGLVSLDRSK